MDLTIALDVNAARLLHLDWLMQLETAFAAEPGGAPKAKAPQSDAECDLGVWLREVGRERYGAFDEVRTLGAEHKKFHKAIEKAVASLHMGERDKAEAHLQAARSMSKDIVYLLTFIELEILERERKRASAFNPLAALGRLFSGGLAPGRPVFAPSSWRNPTILLDVTYARLLHLKWTAQMSRLFRNFGRGVTVQSHEACQVGSWLNRVGLRKYAHVAEIGALDAAHIGFHDAARRTIESLKFQRFQQAQDAYGEVNALSREIIYLLTVIEYRLELPAPG